MLPEKKHNGTSEELLTTAEAATFLRVSQATVWRWCREGVIPAARIGHIWRIRRQDILDLFNEVDFDESSSIQSP